MEKFPPKPMTPLDELVTPPTLYTLKLLLPYMPASTQRTLAVFVKFFEFKRTMEIFYGFGNAKKGISSDTILSDLKPYMNPKEQEMMEQMEGMMNMMEMMKQMQEDSNNSSDDTAQGPSPFDLVKGMMDPQQQSMFDMYNDIFSNVGEPADSTPQKGKDDYE
ncbi:MAG: hypothetical protein HFH03_06490 [Dorea sp.]|jgi:hypothetical protein|nr:hypothetical protein [Dorea sp.]